MTDVLPIANVKIHALGNRGGRRGEAMIDFYLKVFLTSAKTGSFTKAAELLNITQPAVTHQIRKLEETFKVKLFVRQRNRICLTKAGEILCRYADQIDRLYCQAKDEITGLAGHIYGNVLFGATSLLGIYLLPLILGGFKQRHPEVNISMHVGNSREVLKCLRDGIVEFAIVSEPVPKNRFIVLPFYQDDLTLIVPPDHPWCREKAVDAERIFEEDFILREQGSGTRAVYTKILKQRYPNRKLKVAMVLGSTEAIMRGVIGKMGISIVSRLACHLETEQGLLREIDMKGLEMKRKFDIVYRSEEDLSVQAMRWKEYLIRQRDRNFQLR